MRGYERKGEKVAGGKVTAVDKKDLLSPPPGINQKDKLPNGAEERGGPY